MDGSIAGSTTWNFEDRGDTSEARKETVAESSQAVDQVWLNGRLVAGPEAHISPFDHGFLYGDGLYETFRVYSGRVWRAADHLVRLEEGCRALEIGPLPPEGELVTAMETVVAANSLIEAYLRLTVSRGPGVPRPRREGVGPPTVFITARPFDVYGPDIYATGAAVALVSTDRTPTRRVAGLKSTSFQESLMMKREAAYRKCDEGLMVGPDGVLLEGVTSNVFLVSGGALRTPPLEAGILAGVTRVDVMALAKAVGRETKQERLTVDDVWTADEMILTSSLMEVLPVSFVDDRAIGGGCPGSVARELAKAYRAMVKSELGL